MYRESKISLLKDRAYMFSEARLFLSQRNLIEVDTPLLSSTAPIDAHIDIIETTMHDCKRGFFHSSPEYAMKRLIAMGLTDIYQISHVFRFGEEGSNHNPEFTMVEWYKGGISFDDMIHDTVAFIRLFLGNLPVRQMSYREAFLYFLKIDYISCSTKHLVEVIKQRDGSYPSDLDTWDKDTLLQYMLSFLIEPLLGSQELFVLKYFPASQAALSQTESFLDERVAKRFEIYFQGVELANGYHELTCAKEQKERFESSNLMRIALGKEPYPIDTKLLSALESGLPDCCGVAVGFDRLMMLRHGKKHIKEVVAFSWSEM